MSRSPRDRVADIRAAIARCLRYSRALDSTDADIAEMAVDAVERNIAVIGEAATHLPAAVTESLPQIDWAGIRGMCNILIHECFGVDSAVIATKLRPLDDALAEYDSGSESASSRMIVAPRLSGSPLVSS